MLERRELSGVDLGQDVGGILGVPRLVHGFVRLCCASQTMAQSSPMYRTRGAGDCAISRQARARHCVFKASRCCDDWSRTS